MRSFELHGLINCCFTQVVHMNLKTGGEEEKKKMEENFIQVSHQLNIAITIAERK